MPYERISTPSTGEAPSPGGVVLHRDPAGQHARDGSGANEALPVAGFLTGGEGGAAIPAVDHQAGLLAPQRVRRMLMVGPGF